MPNPLLDSFQELEDVWEHWTGGALFLANRHRMAERSDIPEELLDQLGGPFQSDGHVLDDAYWWICPVSSQLSLVASASEDNAFSRVLPSWAALLRLQVQQSAQEPDTLQQRVTHELALAAEIQSSLFPTSMPVIPGFDLAADLLPARQVGGDFFDLSRSKNGKYVLAVGDVAGKGASASILTAVAHALLHSASMQHDQPAKLLETINARMYADLDRAETFITMVLVFLDTERQEIQLASAGHVDAMLWRSQKESLEMLPATGLPLGIYPSTPYTLTELSIEPGDVLCLYTDGITEAEGPDGKLLGVQGLADLLYACHLAPSRAQVDVVLTALEVHRRGVMQRDDVALLLCRCEGEEREPRMVQPFVVAAESTSIRSIVDLVRNLADEAASTFTMLEREPVEDFALALAEVVTNQIKHAYRQEGGRIQGRLVLDKNTLSADTFDYGHSFHPVVPEGDLDPENPPEGGFGMQLIDALTDDWRYTALEGGRNHWHLQKHIAGTR